MNALSFVIVSQSLILHEGIFAFLRENSYSPNYITKLNNIEQFDRSSMSCDSNVMILDDSKQQRQDFIDTLSRYSSPSPKLKIIVLSLYLNTGYIGQVVENPNTGFIYRDDMEQHFFSVLDMLNLNMMSISPTALRQYLNTRQILELGGITDSDLEVLRCIANGLTVDDMIEELGTS